MADSTTRWSAGRFRGFLASAVLAGCGASHDQAAADASSGNVAADGRADVPLDMNVPSDLDAAADTQVDEVVATSPDASVDTNADGPSKDPRIVQLLATASSELDKAGAVGASIALVVDGKLAYAGGVGVRALGGEPVDGDTLFLTGSTTKMLTASTVLSLVQEGKLDLEAPLLTYLPRLAVESPFNVRDMTLSKVLSHRDGLEDNSAVQCGLSRFSDYGASAPVTLWGTPGTFWDYSNNDMVLAAQAIESVTSPAGYERAVHDRVFVPAGMATATFDAAAAAQSGNVATGYGPLSAGGPSTQPASIAQLVSGCPILEPAGFAIASARDFGNFVVTMLNHGGAMLRPESVSQMETGWIATGANPNYQETYGYGLFIDVVGGETVIHHGGDLPPFHSEVALVPQAKFGFVMMISTNHQEVIAKVESAAIKLFAPPPETPSPPVRTQPSQWGDYVGKYVDLHGKLGSFSLALEDASLVVGGVDAGDAGGLIQINGDQWALPSNPPLLGVFWRDDAGAVREVVTRSGVAVRQPKEAATDAGASD